MATSAADICNMALDYLGTGNITSLEEAHSDNAKLCNRWYDVTRKSLLKDLNASFAIKRQTLAVLSSAPVYGRTYQYQLPADCIKLLNVDGPLDIQDYQIEDNKVLYDSNSSLNVRYIYNCQDVAIFDDEFKECLALYIASNICMQITKDIKLTSYINQLKKQKYNDTAFKYAKDNPPKRVSHSRFMDSKNNLTYENENYFRGALY